MQEWNSLTNEAKNKILRFIFSEWRVEGEALNEKIIPLRRTAEDRELPPIPLITGVGLRKKGARIGEPVYKRRLPDAANWYADLQRYLTAPLQHIRNSTTGQMTPWAEMRNFALDTDTHPSVTVAPWPDDES